MLEVVNPSFNDQQSFFYQVAPENIVRIFLPTDTTSEPGNRIVKADDLAIIGPGIGDIAGFGSGQQQTWIFEGEGIVKFRVEGIEFGAMVDITASFEEKYLPGGPFNVIGSDKVRMRVAPFVMADHKMNVSLPAGDAKTVYVSKWEGTYPSGNEDVRNALREEYLVGHLDEVDDNQYRNDIWHQDPSEIGYVRAPYGSMPVFLVSPRAKFVYPYLPYPFNKDLLKYIHRKRLEPNVGVCWRFEGINNWVPYDAGGNIESVPVASGPGKLLYGTEFHPTIEGFFSAQGVNPFLEVNTAWLTVGHVDEVISFAPTGRTVVADPEVCWALLVWADSKDQDNAKVLVNRFPYSPDYIWVYLILTNDNLRGYNFNIVMASDALPSIRTALNLPSPETVTRRYSGNGELTKGGAFVGFFPNSNKRKYRITFSNSTDYSLQYQELPSGDWLSESNPYSITIPVSINRNQDCIFKDARCFVLKHWLQGTFQQGDYFEFEADPSCSTIEMPVLFYDYYGGAAAYTINHVNCLVDGQTVFTGQTHEQNTDYVIRDYVTNMFGKAGFSQTIMADSRFYHWWGGDIHCGTNVQRVIPSSYKWWEY
jgi:hypothetical protein